MATNNIEKQSFGEAGALYCKDTGAAVSGEFCAITSLHDGTYFSALTWPELATGGSADALAGDSNATLPKGVTLYGQISGFTLGGGRVIAYYASR